MTVERVGNATIIRVFSELDVMSNPELLALIVEAEAGANAQRIIVDLTNCSYCDSGTLMTVMRTHMRLGERFFIVLHPQSFCARVFRIVGIDKMPFVVGTLDQLLTF